MRGWLVFALAASLLAAFGAEAGCNLDTVANIPIRVENGHIFIQGKIDTHPVDFLVDPGSRTILLRSAAEEYGIRPDKLLSLQESTLLGLAKDGGPAALDVEHLPIAIAGELSNFGTPLEVAVLGMDFLSLYDVELDVEHRMLNLFRPTGCERTNLAYWTRRFSVADMVPNINSINVPPYNAYNYPHVNFHLTVNGREMLAALEPGFINTSLSFAAAATIGVGKNDPGVTEVAATHDLMDSYVRRTWSGAFDSVKMDRESISPAKIDMRTFEFPVGSIGVTTGTYLHRPRPTGEDVVIGSDFLLSHRVFIAYSQNKIYFSPSGNQPYLGGVPVLSPP